MANGPLAESHRLRCFSRGQEQTLSLDENPITLGRAPENALVLSDPRASRHHARIETWSEGFRVVDLGSQNGTWVNGRRIRSAPLRPGDDLRVGAAILRIESDQGEAAVAVEGDDAPSRARTTTMTTAANSPSQEAQDEELLHRFRRVAEMARALCQDPSSPDLLQRIVDAALDLTGAERGFLLTAGKEGMTFAAARHLDQREIQAPEFEVSWSIAIAAGTRGESVFAVNASEDPRFSAMRSVESLGLRSILAVPVPGGRGVVGAIYLDNRLVRGAFTEIDQEVIALLAAQAGIALTNRELVTRLKARAAEVDRLVEQQEERLSHQDAELAAMRRVTDERRSVPRMIGESARMEELRQLVRKVAATDFPVLVHGESGTGKELVARAIHDQSTRAEGNFVAINCAALPETLLENELFGHAEGAYTGADAARTGLFAEAHGGTIFLDEVSEMSPGMQSRLLRVLQEGEYRPIGAKDAVRTDARVIAASHRELARCVSEGAFREDLFYRLDVLPVTVPPLRNRREDIPLLIQHFFMKEGVIPAPRITPEAMDCLTSHAWPGNVRELENEVRRLAALAGDVVDRAALGKNLVEGGEMMVGQQSSFEDLNELVQAIESREIKKALDRSEGNKTRAASLLGITRFALQRKLEKYAIDP